MIRIVGVAQKDKESLLYYYETKGENSFFKVIESRDGFEFDRNYQYASLIDEKHREEKNYNWKSFRIAKQGDQYLLTYRTHSKTNLSLHTAVSTDRKHWKKTGHIEQITETGAVVPDYKYKDRYVMYVGGRTITIAYSSDLQHWETAQSVLAPRSDSFDNGDLEVGNAYQRNEQILMTYYVKRMTGEKSHYLVGAALFDKKNPIEPVWRSEQPVWEPSKDLQQDNMSPLGSTIIDDELILYWIVGDNNIYTVSCQVPSPRNGLKNKVFSILFKKFDKNPIISPDPRHPWESRATFNSAAVYEAGKVHFLYRALGDKDLSVLGYATSSDGLHIDERSEEPAYIPREPFETPGGNKFNSFAEHFMSGSGYGGIEDPRMTKVGDRFYLTYVAFDGATPPRAAMSSIAVDDFLNRNWGAWEKPRLISAPGMVNKSAVLFPRKVNGKYVVLHRVYPNILVDFLDDLSFRDYLQGHYFIPPRKNFWDSKKVGAGAPPMETKDGWLLIYQSVGYQDPSRYKIGAMMLDKNNPSKVLYRTSTPIVEPVESYENDGFKAGVVYPCGAVIMKDKLHVYYGGADSVVCAASTDLDKFLWEMKNNREPKLGRVNTTTLG